MTLTRPYMYRVFFSLPLPTSLFIFSVLFFPSFQISYLDYIRCRPDAPPEVLRGNAAMGSDRSHHGTGIEWRRRRGAVRVDQSPCNGGNIAISRALLPVRAAKEDAAVEGGGRAGRARREGREGRARLRQCGISKVQRRRRFFFLLLFLLRGRRGRRIGEGRAGWKG